MKDLNETINEIEKESHVLTEWRFKYEKTKFRHLFVGEYLIINREKYNKRKAVKLANKLLKNKRYTMTVGNAKYDNGWYISDFKEQYFTLGFVAKCPVWIFKVEK
jgi:hypothetical protein